MKAGCYRKGKVGPGSSFLYVLCSLWHCFSFGLCICQSIVSLSLIALSTDQYNIFVPADNKVYINALLCIQPTLLNRQKAQPTNQKYCQSKYMERGMFHLKEREVYLVFK